MVRRLFREKVVNCLGEFARLIEHHEVLCGAMETTLRSLTPAYKPV